MELRVLNYFLMIAREENITRAANLLHISQPTLSRQIANLEEELGTKLFVRQSHKITLTEDGMLLRRRAEEMRQLSDKIKDELSSDKTELSGNISIGSGEFRGMNELSDIIVSFHKKYPLVTFNIQSGNAKDINFGIEQGLLDMGVMIEPVDTTKYDFARFSQMESWGILIRNDSPLSKKIYITAKDLKDQALIMSHSQQMQNEINHWFGRYAKSIEFVSTYNLLYNSAILVKRGLGSALSLNLEAKYDDVTFVPLKPALTYNSVLAWKADETSSRTVSTFIEFAKKYLESISKD
ncbi:LysR family transcriptional regulator [Companilactobacillus alimentarius]|uniref:LysR family transcriptional regulator n=1 Tax=Companilactobacillus alimentarius DSM 20249 TaxID=1423720 RepID=A0A2K9HGK6_9LACO|nr:LysR family transcriptional regulator [Companilactobacillus alimentarius]AUI71681.1 LysR family transcriptional regulator [Companilactobacillus alimentarius DSM 20249]KRK78304.1 LysR family transcriptional regulator [Companilactobacillus alimentarius DSM 20249]MDT6953327.1 LysR family transcriptional regulator [Companilactobacillus alimentarius]GEO44576.1 LysR family transcriptional regulator [Companilactobacillus alimentarius]